MLVFLWEFRVSAADLRCLLSSLLKWTKVDLLSGRCDCLIGRVRAPVRQSNALIGRVRVLVRQSNALIGHVRTLVGQSNALIGRVRVLVRQSNSLIGRVRALVGQSNALIGRLNQKTPTQKMHRHPKCRCVLI